MRQDQGRLLGNRYRLIDTVGRGGMGTVWRAHDEVLEREVAIKQVLLPPGLEPHDRDVLYQRTFREARASARLNHPSVVTVHDVVEVDGTPWIVMEYVRARSLQDIIDRDGPVTPRVAADIGRQVLAALNAAHKLGILHRDVKPSNVLITADGRAVLTDFGIAKMEGDATLTQTGLVMGSPAYIPPERAQGEKAVPASDLWALGATLYASVEGKAPYERSDAMAALAAALTEPVPVPHHAGALRPVLEGLLARRPVQRMTAEVALPLLIEVATAPVPPPPRQPVAGETVTDQPATGTVRDPPARPTALDERAGATVLDSTAIEPAAFQESPPPPRWSAPAVPPVQEYVLPPVDYEARTRVGNPGWTQPPYDPYPYQQTGRARPRGGRTRTALIVLIAAIVIAVSLVVGALILKGQRGSGGTGASGYTSVTGQGFKLEVPTSWAQNTQTSTHGSFWYAGQASQGLIQIDQTAWIGADAKAQAVQVGGLYAADHKRFPGYRLVGVTPSTYKDAPAADLEFTFTDPNTKTPEHVKDRFCTVGGQVYAIYFRAPDSDWATAANYLSHVFDTFRTG
ncbi:MAG: serine/threonine protein kinase [Actinomycetia bacterium]|nr:serine/threonine protein kinase [Actinomycetes bacterium]